jgi:hypothetical protein
LILRIVDWKGEYNHVAGHLSKMEIILNDPIPIDDYFVMHKFQILKLNHHGLLIMLILLLQKLSQLILLTNKERNSSMT